MSPFVAALIAAGYMGTVFFVFGLVWRDKSAAGH